MKKKLNVLMFLALFSTLLSMYSCVQEDGEKGAILYNELKEKLLKDPDQVLLNKAINNRLENVRNNKYKKGEINEAYIKQNLYKAKTYDDMVKIYTEAGYENAKEMVRSSLDISYFVQKMYIKYPELKELSKDQRSKLFEEISYRNYN